MDLYDNSLNTEKEYIDLHEHIYQLLWPYVI